MVQFIKQNKLKLTTLVGCILLFVSLMVDTLQTVSPSVTRAKKIIERKLHVIEIKTNKVLHQPELLNFTTNYSQIDSIIKEQNLSEKVLFFLYKEGSLVYWSNNSFIPENIDKLSERDIHFFKQANGYYEVQHNQSKDNRVNVYALIPVYYQYSTNNKFLTNGFVWKHPFLKRFIISNKETKNTTSINDNNGNYLFSIRISDDALSAYNPYIVFVEILGLLLLFWSIYQIIKQLFFQKKYLTSILSIILVVVLAEILFNQLRLFSLVKSSLLFSSNLYASTYLSNTLGALLIRTFLITWATSFIQFIPHSSKIQQKIKWLLMLPVIAYFLLVFVIQSIIQNSVISFNFYLVNTLDVYTLISLVIFGLGFSTLLFITKWIFEFKIPIKQGGWMAIYGIIGVGIGFAIGAFSDIIYAGFVLVWFLNFVFFFHYEKSFFQENTKYKFLSNLILLSFISFLTSVIIINNTGKKDIEKRKYRMQELVSERDIGEEYTLTESEKSILEDNFIKSYFKNPYLSTIDIEKRLSTKYYKSLLRRYNISMYAYDKDGEPLIGIAQKEFYKVNNLRFSRKAKTISKQFYYLAIKENGEKYLGYFPIQDDSVTIGYLFVEFIPKIFSSYSAYPELLMKQSTIYDEEFDDFSYAIYDNNYLVKQKGNYEYKLNFDFPININKQFTLYKSNGYNHMIYYSKDKQIVLSEKNRPVLSTIAVFSYMLIFFLLFFIVLDIAGFSNRFWGEESVRDFFKSNTLQKQIQNSMIVLVLFSLVIIAVVTMVYFRYQYNIYQNGKLLRKVNMVMKNVSQYYIEDYPTYGAGTFDKISQQKIRVLSSIHALDINIYNAKGELIQASQPEIFKRNLVSTRMDASAYFNLVIKEKSKYVHDEKIGGLEYLSAYQPFRSNGKVLGYYNFPYYGKQKSFQEDISYFLVALVNVYVVFLIAAAFLAVILSRSITNSLTLISDNIKDVQLGKANRKITWKNEDEIGLLVKQYNKMLDELEKSAGLLARSEREGAWREMAKQVAHEIKNPLTPMKLSIQHLQRALKDNIPDVKELTEKISQRLIEQIENLSNIATAFSDFAKMPQGNFIHLDIIPILSSTVELFQESEQIEIKFQYPENICLVNGDKEQLMRVFTNIIKNAIQAIPENQEGIIDILLEDNQTNFLISIKDNGVGIAEEKRNHIFEPNFTTKSSGSGLGLAISKNIIERMSGKIWFESTLNSFTTFYIEIPSVKQS